MSVSPARVKVYCGNDLGGMGTMAIGKKQPTPGQRSKEFEEALAKSTAGAKKTEVAFDLPVAGNVIEWVSGAQFLNFSQVWDHWGQFGLLLDMEQILCPLCNKYLPQLTGIQYCWGKSVAELKKLVLLQKVDDDYKCPKCNTLQTELRSDGLIKNYNSYLIMLGMRSGKSASAGLYATYLEHRILTDVRFRRYALSEKLKQAPGTSFEVAFVATTSEQTEKTTFDYFRNFRERSPWTNKYVARIKELEKRQSKTGMQPWKYSETDKEVNNELVGVKFVSLHSNSAGMAGATRLAAFVDELARFDTSESKRGADEVWRVLSASLKTVRTAAVVHKLPQCVYGLRLATSSPISVDDKMYQLVTKATASDNLDHVYPLKLATWEFNPFQPRCMFDEEYAEDAVQAERDFGANPPLTETPFLDDVQRFAKSIEPGLSPSVLFETSYPEDALGRQYVGIKVTDSIISPEVPRFITFDAGSNFDSFAGAMGHPGWVDVLPDPNDEDQRPRRVLLTIYDWVFRILPTEKPKRTVWFDSVAQIIRDLQNNFRITRVSFDRWNSISLIQDIRNLGIEAEDQGVVTDDFLAFRADCYAGKVKLLPPEPSDQMDFVGSQLRMAVEPTKMSGPAVGIYELVKLSRSDDLKKVFNPNKGKKRGYDSDDTAQVIVGVHRLVQEAMADDKTKNGLKERLRREQHGGQMWGGGAAVQAKASWAVQPGAPDPRGGPPKPGYSGAGRKGIPGYGDADTFVGADGKPSKEHAFAGRGVVPVRRW